MTMTYKEIFGRAFSDIYSRFPLSDTETICRNIADNANLLHISKLSSRNNTIFKDINKKKKRNMSFLAAISAMVAVPLMLGIFVRLYFSMNTTGVDIISPGYAERQAEIEDSRSLDKHQITDEERSDNGSVEVGLTVGFENMSVKVDWYKFDGFDLIIKYSAAFYEDIPEDTAALPRPTANTVNYPDGRETEQSPCFEKYDTEYRSGNTFCMYSKISPVLKPTGSLDIAIDNRCIDGENSPYLFTAIANIPAEKQPIDIYTDLYVSVPENSVVPIDPAAIHLTKLTLRNDGVIYWFDPIGSADNHYPLTDAIILGDYAQVYMDSGRKLVFEGGYSSTDTYIKCNLKEGETIDPRDVSEVYLCGEPVYLKSSPENDTSDKNSFINAAPSDIIFNTVQYGRVILDSLYLTPTSVEFTFTPDMTNNITGGGIVAANDFSVSISFHDGNVKDISDLPHSIGVAISSDTGLHSTTLTYDLSDHRTAPRYVGNVTINGVTVPLENFTAEDGSEIKRYVRSNVVSPGNTVETVSPAPVDAFNIGSAVQESGLVGTTVDKNIQPGENWVSLPSESE